MLFERGTSDVKVTQLGLRIVEQAQRVLVEAGQIKEIAQAGKDPLGGPLRVGAIFTIGPYLLPRLIPQVKALAPRMPLILEENYTASLAESLKRGDLDVAILALPFEQAGLVVQPIYEEPFRVLMPSSHPWAQQSVVGAHQLAEDQLLLLGAGNCFRDQVLEVCPECSGVGGLQRTLQGSSLETIRLMVASGIGVTVLPATAADDLPERNSLLATRPFEAPEPSRTIALAWRVTYPRSGAIDVIRKAILACALPGVRPLGAACHDVTV
jgi:LysR family transcriptional regulator, hydrogen peroxide-inducible genes activator